MENLDLAQALPAVEAWLRATIADELNKALQADRVRRQYVKRYTREEAAQRLGISNVTLWQWIKDGKINAVRVGKRLFFTEDEICRILQK